MGGTPEEQDIRALKRAARDLRLQLESLADRITAIEIQRRDRAESPPADEVAAFDADAEPEFESIPTAPPFASPAKEDAEPESIASVNPPVFQAAAIPPVEQSQTPAEKKDYEQLIGQTWLNRAGAVILLLALVFFVKYAFDQGWLSPVMRVSIGGIVGLGLVAFGEFSLLRDLRTFAGGLLGCGIGILYLSAFGTYNFYHLVEPQAAFILYSCVTLFSIGVSVHARMLPVAVLALLGGFGTPIALSTGESHQVALLSYVLVLDVGFLAVASFRRWDVLRVLAWLGTAALFGGWFVEYYDESARWLTAGFLLAFYVVFHGETLWALRRETVRNARLAAGVIHADNAVFFASIYFLLRDTVPQWMGVFAVLMATLQWLFAWRVCRPTEQCRASASALWQNGAAMLALAAPMQFDRYLVSVSWSVQAAVTFWFCRRNELLWLRLKGFGVLAAAALHLIVYDCQDDVLTRVTFSWGHWTFAWILPCFLLFGICAYCGAGFLGSRRRVNADDRMLAGILIGVGTALMLGIFAAQWERYLATWWWFGLGAIWWAVALRIRAIVVVPAILAFVIGVKFLTWDTLTAALGGGWNELTGIVFNRAVVTGVLVSGFIAMTRPMAADISMDWFAKLAKGLRPAHAWTWLALLIVTWTGTFEVHRVFRFELSDLTVEPEYAVGVFVTAFWAINAGVLWVWASARRPHFTAFALLLTGVTAGRLMFVDTLLYALDDHWRSLQGICSNRTFIIGLLTIGVTWFAYRRFIAVYACGGSRLCRRQNLIGLLTITALLVTWIPTFEILRVFQFEEARSRFEDSALAMHVFLSVFWSLNATGLLVVGFVRGHAVLRYMGIALFTLTIAKVFIYDMSHLDMVYRIVSFFVLGILLLFASLLYQRRSSRQENVTATASIGAGEA